MLEISSKSNYNNYNKITPFRHPHVNALKVEKSITPLTRVSRFTSINIATIIPKNIGVSYIYVGKGYALDSFFRKNLLSFAADISNIVSSYSSLTCKIHLKCLDEIVSMDAIFKKGHFEEFS